MKNFDVDIGNPFTTIYQEIKVIRELVQEIKQNTSPELLVQKTHPQTRAVDIDGLRTARPFIGSKSTLYKLSASGGIPSSKRGKKLYFDLDEIDKWLLSNKKKTVEEIEQETDNYLKRKGLKNG